MNQTDHRSCSPVGLTPAPGEVAHVFHRFPWEKQRSYSRGDPYAKVWCYFTEGAFEHLVGSLRAIEQHITEHERPCLAHFFFGRYACADLTHLPIREAQYHSLRRGYWRFCNVSGLHVLERRPGKYNKRAGNNDHFVIEHVENTKLVKQVLYRRLPKPFPKDFLYVVKGANDAV